MSVRVNLLPDAVRERSRANQARVLLAVAGIALLAVLGGLTWLQQQSITDAEGRLAAVEATNETLRADIAALQPFADLEARATDGVELVGVALGDQGSFATILQDLSAVLPPTAQINQLSVSFVGSASAPAPGGDRLVYGSLSATGFVLDGLAPGVERLIIDLDRVAAFENAFVSTTTVDEDGVTTFTLELQLGPEVLTERYGLTPEGGAS